MPGVYLTAENLFCWSPLYKHSKNFDVASIYGQDVDIKDTDTNTDNYNNGRQVYNYPVLKSIGIGLSITF